MNIFTHFKLAIKQSYNLIFTSLAKGIETTIELIAKIITFFSDVIQTLHKILSISIEMIINVSSIIFVILIPIAFFLDPLNWSGHIFHINEDTLFVIRMALGIFFLLVDYYLVVELIKSWKENINENKNKDNIVSYISKFISWVIISLLAIYYILVRFILIDIDLTKYNLPSWIIPFIST